MASVRKRGTSYQITVSNGRDSKGKQLLETATFTPDPELTLRQQQKALDKFVFEFEERVKNGKLLKGDKLTLLEYSDHWLKEYAENNLEATTLSSYRFQITSKIIPALGHLKISAIKPLHLQAFYNNLTETGVKEDSKAGGYSNSSIKKVHAILSSMLSSAVQWQLIESNPCDRVKPPRDKEKSKGVKHFTLDQTETFLKALDMDFVVIKKAHDRVDDTGKIYHVNDYQNSKAVPTQFKLFFNIAIFGGLRKSEILGLTWNDVDFESNMISVNKATVYADKQVYTKQPKNETSERTISLPHSVMDLLKKYRIEQQQYRLMIGEQWIGENDIFIQWNGKKMHPSTPYHTFKKIIHNYNGTVANECEILPDIPLHGLRHTSATLLIADKVDIKTVANRLGHAQTSTTLNIYAAALRESDVQAANSLENMIKRKA